MGIGWGPGAHLEAEGRLNGGLGAEPPITGVRGRQPPGSLLALFWVHFIWGPGKI